MLPAYVPHKASSFHFRSARVAFLALQGLQENYKKKANRTSL